MKKEEWCEEDRNSYLPTPEEIEEYCKAAREIRRALGDSESHGAILSLIESRNGKTQRQIDRERYIRRKKK